VGRRAAAEFTGTPFVVAVLTLREALALLVADAAEEAAETTTVIDMPLRVGLLQSGVPCKSRVGRFAAAGSASRHLMELPQKNQLLQKSDPAPRWKSTITRLPRRLFSFTAAPRGSI
jgi:hypothetical protein